MRQRGIHISYHSFVRDCFKSTLIGPANSVNITFGGSTEIRSPEMSGAGRAARKQVKRLQRELEELKAELLEMQVLAEEAEAAHDDALKENRQLGS